MSGPGAAEKTLMDVEAELTGGALCSGSTYCKALIVRLCVIFKDAADR